MVEKKHMGALESSPPGRSCLRVDGHFMSTSNYKAILQTYKELSEQLEHGPAPAFYMMPLGALRKLVGERFKLEDLRADVRNLVLEPDLEDTEIVVMTGEDVGVIVFVGEDDDTE